MSNANSLQHPSRRMLLKDGDPFGFHVVHKIWCIAQRFTRLGLSPENVKLSLCFGISERLQRSTHFTSIGKTCANVHCCMSLHIMHLCTCTANLDLQFSVQVCCGRNSLVAHHTFGVFDLHKRVTSICNICTTLQGAYKKPITTYSHCQKERHRAGCAQ